MNFLVVDDDPSVRIMLQTVLTGEGHTVHTAEDGKDALEKLAAEKVDMIVSDVKMPNMDGIQLRDAIREMPDKARMPFLFVSGYDDQRTIEAVKDPSVEGFFKKGRPLTALLAWINLLSTPVEKRTTNHPGNDIRFVAG